MPQTSALTVTELFDLTGKTALVVGGSRGLGLHMAFALGEAGARLMLCARQADALEAACANLQAAGLDARWVAADCTQAADLQKMLGETLQRLGDIDILVTAASINPLLPSQWVVQHAMLGRGGRIIYLACQCRLAETRQASRLLAAQWRLHGITVNTIVAEQSDGVDLKGATILLASAAGRHITGQCLQVPASGTQLGHKPSRAERMSHNMSTKSPQIAPVVATERITVPTTHFGVEIPFVSHLGFVLTAFADGKSEIWYTPKPEHLNSYSVTHGGAVMTLLDVTMAMAARASPGRSGVVTIEMKTSFMRPSHGTLTACGVLKHHTATLAFTEATVFDNHGKACAHATGTFKYIQRLPVGAKGVNAFKPEASS